MERESLTVFSAEEMTRYRELADQFAKKSLQPIFQGEYSDGNLSLVPGVLQKAFEIGMASAPDESLAGYQYGIWGRSTDEQGVAPSIILLMGIAQTCGGVAMCLHVQGIATHLMVQSKKKLPFVPLKAGWCLQEGFCPPYPGTLRHPGKDSPAQMTTFVQESGGDYIIHGSKSFVYAMPDPDAYVVLARLGEQWACFLVNVGEKGIEKTDVGVRTGLRACLVEHIKFEKVRIPKEARIDDGDASSLVIRAMSLNWVGMSAIAVGIARGALSAARKYAAERYQGGKQIEEHSAIQMLIAGAETSTASAEANLFTIANDNLGSLGHLKKSAAVKLSVTDLCSRAVTDCLQTFGGYGYMEDFGMEKRLRDVTVLKSALGSPTYLKQFIFDIEREGRP
jgi:alkylation response protein AidB-like acyl-CoA dehydrogenase